jgi:hypothetical protein
MVMIITARAPVPVESPPWGTSLPPSAWATRPASRWAAARRSRRGGRAGRGRPDGRGWRTNLRCAEDLMISADMAMAISYNWL